ncbi:MAG TPA: EAL domain-containing protein [Pseudolabrys sp.]|jgi:sensor c-di-GMP phosphodiesterase-like protein|nr:EAL domain-containing protein [Pseudolabrys sp.]
MAIVAGAFLAGVPLLVFNFWLGSLIDRQGQTEIDSAANRAVALANGRLSQALGALDELALQNVSSCGADATDTLRRAAFQAAPVKEIEILSADGRILCDDSGHAPPYVLLSTQAVASRPGVWLDFLRVDERETMVRLRRPAASGSNQLAALVPVLLLLPQAGMNGGPLRAYAGLVTADGISIGGSGARPGAGDGVVLSAQAESKAFGYKTEVAAVRGALPAEHGGIRWLGLLVSGLIIAIVAVVIVLLPRRNANDPVAQLSDALAAGEFVPYYQPIVDIRSGQLRGAEVLVRWRKPDGSLVLPGAFIPLAESSGLIKELTLDLMRRVCVESGRVLGRRPALKISFNFAGNLFADESIVRDVRKIFLNSPIKLTQVVLEVTERDPIENLTQARQIIATLQGLGIRIAIDDVGTGHSGLSYMLKLGVDIIKIDKMFVDAIGTDRNSTTIVETLVDLAHNMRMDVVAEGVENFEQVMHLREVGIRSAQGYVFAPPLPGSAFLQLVEAIDPVLGGREAANQEAA